MKASTFLLLISLAFVQFACSDNSGERPITDTLIREVTDSLTNLYGKAESERITRGVNQVAALWRTEDGSWNDFESFCMKNFMGEGPELDQAFITIEKQFEVINGHIREINLYLDYPIVTHQRPVTELDRLLSKSNPSTDFYGSKLAFAIALNFPHYTLEEKEKYGEGWTRKEWAMVRIGDMFDFRPDPEKEPDPLPEPDDLVDYTELYIISMDQILSPDKEIMFPAGTRLNCHNGLRDEIKGLYTRENPLVRQRMISQIVMHIIYQTIPECMIGETEMFWNPDSNEVFKKEGDQFVKSESIQEPDRRYKNLYYRMKSKMNQDAQYPEGSTYISRTFENRQLPEERVVELLESIVGAPERIQVAEILKQRLGRDLEPFDMWYSGFQSQSNYDMDKLDRIIRDKYPTPLDFQNDIPNILRKIGFDGETADFLGEHVIVDPVPSGGHANAPQMHGAKAHLRTRFEPYGLNYKGFRIGMHEIGHTIEQNVAMYQTDYYFMKGIPSSPYTECMADLIAYRDMVGLGISSEYSQAEKELNTLASFWYVYEHGSIALHEIRVWHWFYDHPKATVDELKQATIDLAKEVWNEFFADIYGVRDVPILSVYNHFLNGSLYLHSYALGNVILMQLEQYFGGRDFPKEMVRMCSIGRLTPDQWMKKATGEPLSSEPMLRAVRRALNNF